MSVITAMESQSEYGKVAADEPIEKPNVPTVYGFGVRHIQSTLIFISITVAFMARAHLGVTVVAMTNIVTNININLTGERINITDEINLNNTSDDINGTINDLGEVDEVSMWRVYRTYEWDKSIQEMILYSFFLGYTLMMLPMGMISQRYGGKIPLQICLLVNGLVSFVTPSLAVWGGWKAVCSCRILQGMSQAGLYPSIHTLLSRWVPISERATFSSYVYTGPTLGTVISFQIGGLLAYSSEGWPSTFWVIGGTCIGAFVLISVFAAASPAHHKTISHEEKDFILGCVDDGVKMTRKTPWKRILTSKPVWAAIIAHIFCSNCSAYLFTQIPTYMHSILGFNIKNSGLLSSLPYIASFISSFVFGLLSDYCTNRKIVSLKTARIVCNSIAQIGPAICLVALGLTDNSITAVVLLVAALALYSGTNTGWIVNYIDLSPNFSGTLMAFGNTCAAFGSLTQPLIVSNIITDVNNQFQWRITLILMAGIICFSNIFYVCFMSVEIQTWNDVDDDRDMETETVKK